MGKELAVLKKQGLVEVERYGDFRLFSPVSVGIFFVSLQASKFHYCSPRETLDSLDDYDSFEIAFFENDGDLIIPSSDERFKDRKWAHLFDNDQVAGYMSREDVMIMVSDLLSISESLSIKD